MRGARVIPETGNRLECHAMVRRREPRGRGEWAGVTGPRGVGRGRAPCAPGPRVNGSKPGEVGPGALCARPPSTSRNHMIQKRAKEAGWEIPSCKTLQMMHWGGLVGAAHADQSHRIGGSLCAAEVSALQLAVAWRTHWLSSRKAGGTTEPSQCRHIL